MADQPLSFRLDDRVAVVTGGASGIGRATVVALAAAGAGVVVGDLDEAGLEGTVAAVVAGGGTAVAVPTDVRDAASVQALVDRAVDGLGRLDVMANVAGIIRNAAVVDTSAADFDEVLAVNLKGVLFGCQAAVPALAASGGGSIVNMASGAAVVAAPTLVSYACSKAGVVALTRVLAMEVGGQGIRVNAVAPGFVATPMTARGVTRPDGTVDDEAQEQLLARMRRRSALGTVGDPADVAAAVVYLASDAARFVTGQVLHPNGGTVMTS